jgi:DNA-binding NarL/FixJ family response regulator
MAPKKNNAAKKRIVLVDDHPMMRQGLGALIHNEPDLEVVGEAENAAQGLDCVTRLKPDLVLADITLPDKTGLELIKDIQALGENVPDVLVISMHDEALYVERVLRAGGRGYIMKQEGGKKLMLAIRQVLSGQVYVSEKMSSKILEIFSGRRQESATSPVETLTDREFEIFQLIGKGLTTLQMAHELHVSNKTIEVHRANIKAKLKLNTAAELLRYAVRWIESQAAP